MDERVPTRLKAPPIRKMSMDDLRARLKRFEAQYGLSSEEFYRQARAGLLSEREEYISWLGYYEAYLRLQRKQQNPQL